MLLARDRLLDQVNQALAEMDLSPLQAQDFNDPAHRTLFQAWERKEPRSVPDAAWLRERLPDSVADRLETLQAALQDLAEEQWIREGVQTALRLRERNLRQMGAELRMLIQEAEEEGRRETTDYGQTLEENARAILQIQQALRARRWGAVAFPTNAGGYGGKSE